MKRLIFVFSILPLVCFSQPEFIKWSSENKLAWNDFNGQANANVDAIAISKINIGLNIESKPSCFVINVSCLFDPSKSWVKDKSTYLLMHEQKHFDLSEVFTRRLRKSIDSLNLIESIDFESLNDIVTKKYYQIERELNLVQFEYDKSTNHSSNIEKQKEWDKKISIWLSELNNYKDEVVIINNRKK